MAKLLLFPNMPRRFWACIVKPYALAMYDHGESPHDVCLRFSLDRATLRDWLKARRPPEAKPDV